MGELGAPVTPPPLPRSSCVRLWYAALIWARKLRATVVEEPT